MSEQALRRHDDEGPGNGRQSLPAQEVEVLGRRGGVGHAHVVFGRKLEEALQACRGVFGALAFMSVGEEEGEAGVLSPFHPPCGDELVDDDLGHIHEIAELGFPENQVRVCSDLVSVFEAQNRGFREGRVVCLEAGGADVFR